tara:strand:- start:324 stop:509 length:186 start_codon:yes stop_codon:yes gene_type:complete
LTRKNIPHSKSNKGLGFYELDKALIMPKALLMLIFEEFVIFAGQDRIKPVLDIQVALLCQE